MQEIMVRNPKIEQAINNLYNKIHLLSYGTTLTWNELKGLAGLDIFGGDLKKEQIYYIVTKVNFLLMQNDERYLVSIHGVGKRIINPNEHVTVAKSKVKSSIRLYKRAGAILSATNLDALSEDEKKEVVMSANKYSTLKLFTEEALKGRKLGKRPKEAEVSFFLDALKFLTKE